MSFWQQIKNNTSPAVLNLVIVNGLMWLATLTFPVLNNYLGLHYFTSERFNFAQLVTYMFMHGNFAHVFFNMFAVYMFGVVLERVWGTKRFLLFYFVTGIGAGLVQELVWAIEYQPMLSVLANGDLNALPSIKGKLYHFFTISNIEWLTSAQMMDMGRQNNRFISDDRGIRCRLRHITGIRVALPRRGTDDAILPNTDTGTHIRYYLRRGGIVFGNGRFQIRQRSSLRSSRRNVVRRDTYFNMEKAEKALLINCA